MRIHDLFFDHLLKKTTDEFRNQCVDFNLKLNQLLTLVSKNVEWAYKANKYQNKSFDETITKFYNFLAYFEILPKTLVE